MPGVGHGLKCFDVISDCREIGIRQGLISLLGMIIEVLCYQFLSFPAVASQALVASDVITEGIIRRCGKSSPFPK